MEITLPTGRKIGDGHPAYIIAEVGSNFRDLNDCLHSIDMAKACGADAVKFQAYTFEALYGFSGESTAHLPIAWLPKLKEKADACKIDFMCTAFSPDLYDAVDPYVDMHKVASAECTHMRILEKLRSLGKPVILSTGAHGRIDIQASLKIVKPSLPVILMYCVAAYPARDIDFRMIDELKKMNPLVGYSDHTTDYNIIPALAVEKGACVIEKHFTDIPEVNTPDRPHSLTVDEFKKMVNVIRGNNPFTWGSGEENPMQLRHNRRLIAIRDIQTGETFQEGYNFGIYRSLKDAGDAASPFAADFMKGKVAKVAIKAGDGIALGDIF